MILPDNDPTFAPRFHVVSLFVECGTKILLLRRNPAKPQGGTWGVPAGKVDDGEEPTDALRREIFEETGLDFLSTDFEFFRTIRVRYAAYDFLYSMYCLETADVSDIVVQPKEHTEFVWVTPQEALMMPLIEDEDACLLMRYGVSMK